MVETASTMKELGSKLPYFELEGVEGNIVSPDDFEDAPALLVMFICNHCPFVKHIKEELAELTGEWMNKGVGVIAINSNNADAYPEDSPENMKKDAEKYSYPFPYLYDETQEVAKAFKAACTPDFFLYDEDRKLVYRGQLDDSRPGNDKPVTGQDLDVAVRAVLEGKEVPADQKPSMGCNIKWRKGTEPDYFG